MTDIHDLLQQYAEAARAKDVDALVSIYDEDVRVFDMWGTYEYRGRDAWRASVEQWLGSLGDESVAVSFDEVDAHGSGASMFVRYAGVSADGEELRSMWNRMTWIVVDGKVVHEHSSSPADESGKVMFSR